MHRLFSKQISWRWPAGIVGLGLVAAAALWLLGLNPPLPKFRLAPDHHGQIVPLNWPWWRQAADWLHGRRYIMLTFDDGPADHKTDMRILRILARHHAHAAFFTICDKADLPGRADDLRQDVLAGDVIGNHSYTHPDLAKLDPAQLRHQIADCKADLEHITGQPVHWFRPPFGRQSPAVFAELKRDGLHDVLWVANSEDSWLTKPAQIEHWATTQSSNDVILLMHSRATTAAALDRTLTLLEQRGYRFVLAQNR